MNAVDALDHFIETSAIQRESEGYPRIAGRLIAIFLLNPGPYSFTELVDRLGVSRASVSNNLRLLRERHLVVRVGRPGDRQDYFQMKGDPYQNALKLAMQGVAAQGQLASDTATSLGDSTPEVRQRLVAIAQKQEVINKHLLSMYTELFGPPD